MTACSRIESAHNVKGGLEREYWSFFTGRCSILFLPTVCHAISRADWHGVVTVVAEVSNNRDLTERGCEIIMYPSRLIRAGFTER